jgi:NADH:ubiquinone oxidoreductase subunit 6 (subunit J)
MVYVGGTMVLLVFGVMLTARGPAASLHTGGGQWIVAVIVGGSLLAVLLQTVTSVQDWKPDKKEIAAKKEEIAAKNEQAKHAATKLGLGLLGVRVDTNHADDGRSGYLLPFEIVSVHLVVVLIGAAYLARARRRKTQLPGPGNAGQAPPLNVVSDDPKSPNP